MRRNLKPLLNRPPDFASFWESTLVQLGGVPLDVQRTPRPDRGRRHRALEYIAVRSFGGVWVAGYLIRWRDEVLRPLVVHSHGYGGACRERWEWSEAGFNVVGIDIRGFGRSFESCPVWSPHGYVLTGCHTPETSVLRGAVCDYVRAVEVARVVMGDQAGTVILHGGSFSGGLALMAEALLQTADLLAVAVPTFGWVEGRHFFVKSGSGAEVSAYLASRPEDAEDLMLVLRYFDPMNFADRIACPTLVGVGLADDVVPANTVYAIANHIKGPCEIMEFPVSHSNEPEEALWAQFDERWIARAWDEQVRGDVGAS